MKPWLSKSAEALRTQINESFADRKRSSDGWIADLRHQKAGKSDHIPDPKGNNVVRAIDIDAGLSDQKGISAYLADQLRQYAKNTGRISYIIHLGQIASPILGWKWRRYRGFSPHNHHIHISFKSSADNDKSPFVGIPLLGSKNEI